ncbi:MAG: GDP-mannose 4,6-dehydratase [Ardenticatenia bacterium]|nr:GDP-mannose 4,6-dehydratase [Ardenticatenia bacterium]
MARALVTGGAGFIGSNLASRLIGQGHEVIIYDNMSRPGCLRNVDWLVATHGFGAFQLVAADVRDFDTLRRATEGVQRVYHLAGQVAVTASVHNPRKDFEENALGTLNVLEAARHVGDDPIVMYASTNKVYGRLEHVPIVEEATRYRYADLEHGISETFPLDFHSPYACSKGAGDQYTRDYARIYGLKTVVMRQSCVYGPRQFGLEDQGWLAWFIVAALKERPITIYGDGKQVRDVLFIEDLLDVYDAAVEHIDMAAGQIYNIGGGPHHTLSVWAEFGPMLEELFGRPVPVNYADWRPGDQHVYISDIRKAERELGWKPRTPVRAGVRQLFEWVRDNLHLFDHL